MCVVSSHSYTLTPIWSTRIGTRSLQVSTFKFEPSLLNWPNKSATAIPPDVVFRNGSVSFILIVFVFIRHNHRCKKTQFFTIKKADAIIFYAIESTLSSLSTIVQERYQHYRHQLHCRWLHFIIIIHRHRYHFVSCVFVVSCPTNHQVINCPVYTGEYVWNSLFNDTIHDRVLIAFIYVCMCV